MPFFDTESFIKIEVCMFRFIVFYKRIEDKKIEQLFNNIFCNSIYVEFMTYFSEL